MPKSKNTRKSMGRKRPSPRQSPSFAHPASTTLSQAASVSDWDSAVALLARGALPDRTSPPYLDSPLSIACMRGDPRMAKLLLGAGADPAKPSFHGDPPIAAACRAGALGVALALCAAGADPSARAPDGKTAIEIACERGDHAMGELLATAQSLAPPPANSQLSHHK